MKHQFIVLIAFLLVFCFSCEKEEIPVPKHTSGSVLTEQIELGSDYRTQLYFDLESNQLVKSNLKTEWDIGFESTVEGYHIKLNSAKGMALSKTNYQNFSDVLDTLNTIWRWDASSGNMDSTALGDWRIDTTVYIINLGYDIAGNPLGFKKLKILSVNEHEYHIEYGNLADAESSEFTITKKTEVNFNAFSFITGQQFDIEPDKITWDLHFTQYTHLFYNPDHAYIVLGVLGNPYNTLSKEITSVGFDEIDITTATSLILGNNVDEIGYDWKFFDFDTGIYAVDFERVFIIQTQEGYFYKLRFIDFYNTSGDKGAPKFEFQQL